MIQKIIWCSSFFGCNCCVYLSLPREKLVHDADDDQREDYLMNWNIIMASEFGLSSFLLLTFSSSAGFSSVYSIFSSIILYCLQYTFFLSLSLRLSSFHLLMTFYYISCLNMDCMDNYDEKRRDTLEINCRRVSQNTLHMIIIITMIPFFDTELSSPCLEAPLFYSFQILFYGFMKQ